jgi:hypothetical protein
MRKDANDSRTNAHESTERVPATQGPSAAIVHWLREPDHAEEFSLADAIDWINRRPLAEVHRLYMHHAETIKQRDALAKALEDLLATFKSHVDGRDLLDELHPRKTIDIKVRVDARERWHEGDWLSNVRDAVRPARITLAAVKENQ